MTQTNELVLREDTTVLQVFQTEGGLDPVIQEARDFVGSFNHDLSTDAGRKRTASLANKVAKLKTRLDGMGKDLVSDWETQAKAVDQSRKSMRDTLDELKIEARKPLTEREEEEERIREQTRLDIEAKRLADEVESGHEMALLMNANVDREVAEAKAEQEKKRQAEADQLAKEQAEREERLKAEAAENARIEAEQAAQAQRDAVELEKQQAIQREEQAKAQALESERQRIAAVERAKVEAEQAEVRAIEEAERAAIRAKQQAEAAVKAEQDRIAEDARLEAEEAAKRERNKVHKGKINRQAVADLVASADLTEAQAKRVVTAMAKRQISAVSISY